MTNYTLDILRGILSRIVRPFRNFNVEVRAHKVISRDKPIPAPKYKIDQESLNNVLKENPQIVQELSKKNLELDNRLKDVYVSSVDIQPIIPIQRDTKLLPISRKVVESHDYGCKEPESVPEGRVTLRNALQFINDHHRDSETYTASHVATQYHLDGETTGHILEYFKTFETHIPKRLMEPQGKGKWRQMLEGKSDENTT